jgi:alpha-ketoglutarate-dependent taurine dioxygenase
VAGYEGVTPVSNRATDGSVRTDDHPSIQILRGNEGWHTDSSYLPVSAMASMLSAHVVPSVGGGTQWADMRAAYDALDNAVQQRLGELSACHSIKYSQARIGFTDASAPLYGYDVSDAPRRPLVKPHPVTGRQALFIGRHAFAVNGLTDKESEALLDGLLADACQPPRLYEHRWSPGDLVMWDNRCVLHRARPYDPTEVRVMHHSRVAGNPITEGV